jgi:hypothetical protein
MEYDRPTDGKYSFSFRRLDSMRTIEEGKTFIEIAQTAAEPAAAGLGYLAVE